MGVMRDIHRRMVEHRAGRGSKLVRNYDVLRLVYVKQHDSVMDAITRERQLKNRKRDWKISLIEQDNPDWGDPSGLL